MAPRRQLIPPVTMDTPTIFSLLPGQEVPVDRIIPALAEMWNMPVADGSTAPSEFRASQMNLILHFGRGTTATEAKEKFSTAVRFSQRYPCRIIVLCPDPQPPEEFLLRAKVYGQCYVGKSRREMSCCEAILLAYPRESKNFLENQVSILLEADLPIYYWIHHFSSAAKVADYFGFLEKCKRIIFDSSVEEDAFLAIPWPRKETVRDILFARLLPFRQITGHFMSSFPAADIVRDLQSIALHCGPELQAVARVFLDWFRDRLNACATAAGTDDAFAPAISTDPTAAAGTLRLECCYTGSSSLHWQIDLSRKRAEISARLGHLERRLPMSLDLLTPQKELAEALFF